MRLHSDVGLLIKYLIWGGEILLFNNYKILETPFLFLTLGGEQNFSPHVSILLFNAKKKCQRTKDAGLRAPIFTGITE